MLSWFLGTLIWVLHVLLVAFVAFAPFSSERWALVLHFVTVPFLWIHWLMNDDTCALTVLEKAVRGVDDSHSFFYNLVSPVYKVTDDTVRSWCWGLSIALWSLTASKVTWADVREELRL